MRKAIAAYKQGNMGLNEVCRQFNVPKSTLKRHMDGKNNFAVDGKKIMGRAGGLPPAVEQELLRHVRRLEESLIEVTASDFRQFAFQIAEKRGVPHRFNKKKGEAGRSWYLNFIRRHPEVSLKLPENATECCCSGRVMDFFGRLELVVGEYGLDASKIFTVGSLSLPPIVNTVSEAGLMSSVVCCVSATGFYVPPMLIFNRDKACEDFYEGAPDGTFFVFNPTGSVINKEIFLKWMQHLIGSVHPTKDEPILLLCDGYSDHNKDLEAIELACDSGVIMLALPKCPVQPLDEAFFKPLFEYFISEVQKYFRADSNCEEVTVGKTVGFFGEAYSKVATFKTAIGVFRESGLCPADVDIFREQFGVEAAADAN